MIEVRHSSGWQPAGALPMPRRWLVEELVRLGVTEARLVLVDGSVLEVRSSEPGGSVGPGAGVSS